MPDPAAPLAIRIACAAEKSTSPSIPVRTNQQVKRALTVETVWACAADHISDADQPIPLAILTRDCWWRELPTAALSAIGRSWRVAYQSDSFPGLRAAVRAGLAVALPPSRSLEGGMRQMDDDEGMPALPPTRRAILISDSAPRDLADAMASAIRSAVDCPAFTGRSCGDCFPLEPADVADDAFRAVRLAGLADVAPVQDQPVMGMQQEGLRNTFQQFFLDFQRRLALRQAGTVRYAEKVRVDSDCGLSEEDIEHDIRGLSPNACQGFQRLPVCRNSPL